MTSHEPSSRAELITDQADYDERYFDSGLGPPYDESEPHWTSFFDGIADMVIRLLAPKTVFDAGCAKGFLVAALADRGVDAAGADISDYAIEAAVAGARGRLRVQSLTQPIEGRWDLVTCIEVLEHMSPSDTQIAIDNICAVTDRVLLSSTPHDFTEPSHVNVRPTATWVSWFAARGFFRRTDLDASELSPWAVVFDRRNLTSADVAYLYEVEVAPLYEEIAVKRRALLEAQRQIGQLSAELESTAEPEPEPEPDFAAADRVLALIDQVVGLQAERAEAGYRHDRAMWLAVQATETAENRAVASEQRVAQILASRSWRTGQALLRPAHLLRRRLRSVRG